MLKFSSFTCGIASFSSCVRSSLPLKSPPNSQLLVVSAYAPLRPFRVIAVAQPTSAMSTTSKLALQLLQLASTDTDQQLLCAVLPASTFLLFAGFVALVCDFSLDFSDA